MANYAKIEIKFISQPFDTDELVFNIGSDVISMTANEAGGLVPFTYPIGATINDTASNYRTTTESYYIQDYFPDLSISVSGDTVTIQASVYGYEFSYIGSEIYVEVTITAEVEGLHISAITQSEALIENKLTHVRHTLTLGGPVVYPVTVDYGVSGTKVAAASGDLWFEYPRYTAGLPTDPARTVTVTDSTI
jgi:hypothetical protein